MESFNKRVVDFSVFGLDKVDEHLQRDQCVPVAKQMWNGFAADGFVYLKNHGIDETEISRVFTAADSFFDLPTVVKNKYLVQKGDEGKHGYVPIDAERLENIERIEHRESYNVRSTEDVLPEADSPGFTSAVDAFYHRCSLLALRVLKAIAIALNLEDEDYFTKTHLPMNITGNYSLLRLINYPPLSAKEALESNIRCGEHSDYGSLTLLFQDEIGGLEAKVRSGEYVEIIPIPRTVVVNIGNILEHMTSGQLLSVRHRVLLKHVNDADDRPKRRRSIAFFVHPVHETLMHRLNGPADPNPENCRDFVKIHVDATYLV